MTQSDAKPIGARECRLFWQEVLFRYPARRKLIVRQWILETLRNETVKAKCLSDYFRHLLETILFSPFDFRLCADHCSLMGGLRVPFALLEDSERAFLVACHAQRDRLWRKIMCGQHGELELSGCVFNLDLQCYAACPPHLDKTWQRILVRDMCASIAPGRWVELIVAVQRLIREKRERFLMEVNVYLQLGRVAELPCWGFTPADAHPAVAYEKGAASAY